MWLIRVADQKLVNFVYELRPDYAILSHRWDGRNPEVSFQDMLDHTKASTMPNFDKIRHACSQALLDGLEYVWIDTCCINKESSAELSEAINSMYRWYKGAKICYALLADVQAGADTRDILDQISHSEWFDRGWTLQELIAPDIVVFFNQSWQQLGTKLSLRESLSFRTGIDSAVLTGWEHPSTRSVAQRMSWASRRKTTRIEDEAYCLLGIFGVNMPMLYGEGTAAFLRLQEEIMKASDDHSIFAWPLPGDQLNHLNLQKSSPTDHTDVITTHERQLYGLLADSPTSFQACGTVGKKASRQDTPPYTMTNRGLSISLWSRIVDVDIYLVRLNCDDSSDTLYEGHGSNCYLGIFLKCLAGDKQYTRIAGKDGRSIWRMSTSLWEFHESFATLHFYVPQRRDYVSQEVCNYDVFRSRINGFRLNTPDLLDLDSLSSSYMWDRDSNILSQCSQGVFNKDGLGENGVALSIRKHLSTRIKRITLGFDRSCNPVCFAATAEGLWHERHDLMETDSHGPVDEWARIFGQAKGQSHPFRTRKPFDKLEWSWYLGDQSLSNQLGYGYRLKESYRIRAIELVSHRGLWAVKGDRVNGLEADLLAGDSGMSVGHLSITRSIIDRGPWRDYQVWDVWLSDLAIEE